MGSSPLYLKQTTCWYFSASCPLLWQPHSSTPLLTMATQWCMDTLDYISQSTHNTQAELLVNTPWFKTQLQEDLSSLRTFWKSTENSKLTPLPLQPVPLPEHTPSNRTSSQISPMVTMLSSRFISTEAVVILLDNLMLS